MKDDKKLLEAILNTPTEYGIITLLEKKDKALAQIYLLDHPFREGFRLAHNIVKEWAQKHYPL